MADIDELLSTTLKRVATPGDSAGVADLIRSRVAAGDTGTPAESSGFGTGGLSWIPWVGAGLVLAVAGTALGFSGALAGSPEPGPAVFFATETVSAGFCPGDTGAATFIAGERVLAIARTDDSAHLAVRDPFTHSTSVWLPAAVVNVDAGEADIESLPVSGCLVPVVTAETAEPAPTAEPEPEPEPGDSTPPTLQQAWADPTEVYCPHPDAFPETTTLRVQAVDNVAVSGVTISWSGAASGNGSMTKVGSEWRHSYTVPEGASGGSITFTVRALDAAGNQSGQQSVILKQICFG